MTRHSDVDTVALRENSRPGRLSRWLFRLNIVVVAVGSGACGSPPGEGAAERGPFRSETAPFDYALSEGAFFDHSGLDVTHLEGRLLHSSPALGLPRGMAVGGRILWVADATTDPGLHAIDMETGELLYSFGRRGEGPGEFARYPWGLQVLSSDPGAVWAWDPNLQRMTRFEPRPVTEYEIVTIQLQIRKPVHRVVWVSGDRILGVSSSDDERFSFFSASGEHLRVVPGHLLGRPDVPHAARIEATDQGIQVCDWPGRGFAIANINVGRIELYDGEATFVRLAEVPFPSEPIFEPDRQNIIRFRSPRRFYEGCAAGRDLLFALFSGRLSAEYEGDRRSSGEFVHVFGWDGRLRSILQLDREIGQVAVDQDGAVLYAASKVDGAIYRYVVPPIPGD